MTHSDPNISQVPSVGADFGEECRALFTVPKGWRQIGADQAGLELRCLGSFLFAFDKGAYIQTVLYGDVHWENAKALFGLPDDLERDEENHPEHKKYRSVAKTFIYAFLYGSGDMNLGYLAGVSDEEAREWSQDPEHRKAFMKMKTDLFNRARKYGDPQPTKQQLRWAYKGLLLRARFLAKFPALNKLIKAVKKAAKKGWLKGLDGRKLPVRSTHAALNTLLQSAGAVICKQWMADVEDALIGAGLKHGWDGDFVVLGLIHDEMQFAVREGLEDKVCQLVVEAARKAGDPFPTWRCPTDGDTKVGYNWAACH
jgi:DNA polymerase I-like protein with 3'-5' exonuclease and polymerase domains